MSCYDDIINLSRPNSNYKKMSMDFRAAQFSPFAALVGYDDELEEVSRITENRIFMSDNMKDIINERLNYINNHIKDRIIVSLIYFKPDNSKKGGKYLNKTGCIKRIDSVYKTIKFTDNMVIDMNDVADIMIDI